MKPFKTIKKHWMGLCALLFWSVIPWFYISPPEFLFGRPVALFALGFLAAGLVFFCLWILKLLEGRSWVHLPRNRFFVISTATLLITVPYFLSPLAPSQCMYKSTLVTVANAQGQNCTTTCTNWKPANCGGWSTCFNKNISCTGGVDQDGRSCLGCCFSCKIDCVPDDDPPVITGALTCDQAGNNGWCRDHARLTLTVSDPQGYPLSITGQAGSSVISCSGNCTVDLPVGSGIATYKVTAATSGLTDSASSAWKYDPDIPIPNVGLTGQSGTNGWYVSTVHATAGGTDAVSGVASALLSVDGGTGVSSADINQDGIHTVNETVLDTAGNLAFTEISVKMDKTAPLVTSNAIGTLELSGWYSSAVQVSAAASDIGSGLSSLLVNVGGTWSAYTAPIILGSGTHSVQFRAIDNAGNIKTTLSQIFQVDLSAPVITPVISGTNGSNGWYTSVGRVSAFATDVGSGLNTLSVAVDEGTWQPYTAPILLNDGHHTVQFQATDGAGNSSTSSVMVKVDTAAPQINMDSVVGTPGLNDWYITNVEVAASASDVTSGLAAFMISVDGIWSVYSGSHTLENGSHTIQFRATDQAGQVTTTPSQIYKVDMNAPDITSSVSGTSGLNGWFISDVVLDAIANDSGSGVGSLKFAVDGSVWQTYSAPIPLTHGQHTVQFQSTDNAGNTVTRNVPVKIDTVEPVISESFSTSEVGGWYAKAPVLTVSASDLEAGIDNLLVMDNEVLIANPVTLTDGIHAITITAADMAGNSSSNSITVKVDTTPPVITPSITGTLGDHGWYVSSVDVNSVFSDETSGVSSTVTLINGSTLPLPYELTDDNEYTVIFNATDHAGNMVSQAVPVNVDRTIPIMEISRTGTTGRNGWYTSAVDLHVTATDVTSGQQYGEYRLDGGIWKVGMQVTVSGDGTHTVEYRVFDQAGNVAAQSETLKIDTTPPSASFLSPSENTPVNKVVRLSGISSDAGSSGLDIVEVSLDEGTSWSLVSNGTWTHEWNVAGIPNGIRSVWARAQDAAGNVSTPSILNLLVDTSGPYISLADPWSFDLAGELRIIPNVYAVKTASITVTDSAGTVMLSSQHTNDLPSIVWWNGQYNGQRQPDGQYAVLVTACDLFNVCSTASSAIIIPVFNYDDPPEPPATPQVIVTTPPVSFPNTETLPPVQILKGGAVNVIRNNWVLFLAAIFLTLLFLVDSVLDPRPRANIKLANAIQQYKKEYPQP